MSTTTIFLGRLVGLYVVIVSLAMLIDRRRMLAVFAEMTASRPWMLFSGMVATVAGLALVIGHQVWHGPPLAILVTLTGWTALAKGLMLLFLPADRVAGLMETMAIERRFGLWMGGTLVFGVVVTTLAFTA
jgi:hypothetical protein